MIGRKSDMERQTELQSTLVECVQTLYISDNIDQAIDRLLGIIAGYYKADRCYIFEFSKDMKLAHNTYEWCAEGITPEKEMLADVDMSVIDRWLDIFNEKGEFYINSLSSEVDSDSAEYRILTVQGIESLMAAPLRSSSRMEGFMGVDNPRQNTDMLILMRLVSAFVVNDLQKRETLEQRILRAIGNTYVSIHMVNFTNDTQQEIKYNEEVSKHVTTTNNATQQMKNAMSALTDPEYLEGALEFTDLTTVDSRMKDINVLSYDFHAADGHWCRGSFVVMKRDDKGKLVEAIFAVQYIDAEKHKELEYQNALKQALENQNEIFAEMLHLQGCGLIASRTDNNKIIVMNSAAQALFGKIEKDTNIEDIMCPIVADNLPRIMAKMQELIKQHGKYDFEFALTAMDGKDYYIKASARTATLACGDDILILTLMDITDKKNLENRLLLLSETDALTHISNRGSGERRVEKLIISGKKGMFCLLDVDKFKTINDSFGHTIGDKALIAIAECLRASFTGEDVVMWLGGDEFAVYAVGVENVEQGREKINALISRVEKIDIPEMKGRKVTISLGAVLSYDSSIPFDKLYPMADAAMYVCKNTPGNQYGFYHEH